MERIEWRWRLSEGFGIPWRRVYITFEIFFEGGTRVESHIRVTEKLVDPIKCRKAFKGESRRAGRTGLDGAIN